MRRRKPNKARGFTLIEVLVTLLFVAIAMPAIMGGFATADKLADSAIQRDTAAGLAESQLNQILAMGTWQNGNGSGNFGEEYPNFQWQSNVQSWAQDESGEGIQQIEVVVTWPGLGGREQSYVLTTLAYPRQPLSGTTAGSGPG